VLELVKPTDIALELVHEWLLENGIDSAACSHSPAKDWIKISLPVSAVEVLLDTRYSIFAHDTGDSIVRASEWSLPLHLHEHIETVQPTNSFFRPRRKVRRTQVVPTIDESQTELLSERQTVNDAATVCDVTAVTPLCLRTLYGTINYTARAPGKNRMGLNNFLGQSNNRSDVHDFLQTYHPEAADAAFEFEIKIIANASNLQTPRNASEIAVGSGLEGDLDAETMLGIAWPTPLTAFSTGGYAPTVADGEGSSTHTNEPYLTWLQFVLSQSNLPQVISTSYADEEQSVPYSYAKFVCNGFAQLGARGVSLFFGSGDDGVGQDPACFTNDDRNASTFLAMFPASCPYVTAVGATKFIPEIVASFDSPAARSFVSGGGFSRYFPRPAYQNVVVPAYIDSLDSQFSGLYNTGGRGYPDLAAQGYHVITKWAGMVVPLDGTSASTPTVAAIFSLINDALISAGKPPMGFLNPWLYQEGYKTFTDVTNGSAKGCATSGFPATKGWDAVTGFGTPVGLFRLLFGLPFMGSDALWLRSVVAC